MRRKKECYEDGIILETDLVAAKYMNPLTIHIIQLFLMISSLYGTIFSLISGLRIEVDAGSIYFFMVISIGVYFLVYSAKRFGLIIHISLLGLYVYAGYVLWDRITNGFWHLENIYIRQINKYYNSSISLYRVDKYEPIHVLNLFFIFFVIFLAFIICQAVLGRLPIFIMFLTTLALIILPLAVGQIPDTLPFAAYVISLFGVLGLNSGMSFGKKHFLKLRKTKRGKEFLRNKTLRYGIGLKTGFLLSLSMGFLLVFLPLIFSAGFYTDQVRVPAIKENMKKSVMEYDASEFIDFFSQGYFANISLFPSTQSTGGLSKGRLGRVATVKYSNRTALKVTVTGDREEIYLKGFAGSVYNGSSWKEFDKETLDTFKDMTSSNSDIFQPANLGSKIMELLNTSSTPNDIFNEHFQMDYNIQNINIQNVNADFKSIYIPYFSTVPTNNSYDINYEPYVKANYKVKDSQFSFYNVHNNILSVDWDQAYAKSVSYWQRESVENVELDTVLSDLIEYYQYELSNRKFAYENYLQIPDQGMDRLRAALEGTSYQSFQLSAKENALSRAVAYVRKFVQSDTKYSLSPGVLPAGKDFVDYFLFENRKGYCTHYASSGAIIFRMLGIPARYVEGYVIKDTDFTKGKKTGSAKVQYRKGAELGTKDKDIYELKIRDANAHAWVEIYLDGFGWVPVEMTPGYSQGDESFGELGNEAETNEPTLAPTAAPTYAPEREEDEIGNRVNDTTDQTRSEEKTNDFFDKLVIVMSVLIFLCTIPLIIAAMIRKSRIKKVALKNTSGKAIFYYVQLKRLFKHFHIDPESEDYKMVSQQMEEGYVKIQEAEFINYMELIKKAKFSSSAISESDLIITQAFYNKVLSYLYRNKPWYKKLYYKYIKVF